MFIPLAESSGLIMDMTDAIMRAVRDEFGAVLAPRPGVKMGFNLTAAHFASDAVVDEVRDIFAGSPIRFSQIVLEITERQPLEDLDMARHVIAALQELGCSVAIDDVGTGHGGLSYLLKLGANCIKIDKMFVDAIGSERYSTPIIETLVELANRMRMEVFAEGVENFDQVKYLRERGIFLAQGYAFAPPLPGRQFRALLEAAHPLSEGDAQLQAIADEFLAPRSAA
jgi:sensor c-di-GMP phosphodiesterase-like protein